MRSQHGFPVLEVPQLLDDLLLELWCPLERHVSLLVFLEVLVVRVALVLEDQFCNFFPIDLVTTIL